MDRLVRTPPISKMPINEDVLEFLVQLIEADMELETSELVLRKENQDEWNYCKESYHGNSYS